MLKNQIVNKSVGELVRTLRFQSRKSQAEMAKSLGIAQTALSRIEKGEREMGVRPWLALMWGFKPNCPYSAKDHELGRCCDTHRRLMETIKSAVDLTNGNAPKKSKKTK